MHISQKNATKKGKEVLNPIFAQLVISLNLVLAGLRLGLKNRQVGEKWVYNELAKTVMNAGAQSCDVLTLSRAMT
jgi:hypothetical protein